MVLAIDACIEVDEVKPIIDKAMALALYARQTKNTEAERKACAVRLRAETRTGELLKELARNQTVGLLRGPSPHSGETVITGIDAKFSGVDGPFPPRERSPYAKALADNNISTQAASRYQALADVPKEIIEEALQDQTVMPSGRAIIEKARDHQHKMDPDSLWFWGRLRDFERDKFFDKDISELMEPMTDSMRADVRRILPFMAEFFNQCIEEVSHESA